MDPADGGSESQRLLPKLESDKSQRTKSTPPYRPQLSETGLEGHRWTGSKRLTDPPLSAARAGSSSSRRPHSKPIRNSKQLAGMHSSAHAAGQGLYKLMGQTSCESPRPCDSPRPCESSSPCDSPSPSQPRSPSPSAVRCLDKTPDKTQSTYLCTLSPPAWCRCNVESCCLVRKCHGHRCNCKTCTVALAVVSFGLLIAVVALAVLLSGRSPVVQGPACPDGWVGYRGKCFCFSEAEGNWTYSRSNCSALGASLAGIDSPQEMDFLQRFKGKLNHWIGLWKDPGQPWKWVNGTKFNNLFEIRQGSDCAFLNDENGVSSSRCTSEEHWICSKPDAFTAAKKTPAEGSS